MNTPLEAAIATFVVGLHKRLGLTAEIETALRGKLNPLRLTEGRISLTS